MRKIRLANHLTTDEIKERMLATNDKGQFQRWQALLFVKKGIDAKDISEYVGVVSGTIYQWIYLYNHEGPDKFVRQGRGGRRFGLMSLEEEASVLDSLKQDAQKGLIINTAKIKATLEQKLDKKISKDYPYDLLHRHGWRKVMPRPEHPKVNKKEQDDFKKNSRKVWQAPSTAFLQQTTDQ